MRSMQGRNGVLRFQTVVLNAQAQDRPQVLLLARGALHRQRRFECIDALQCGPQPLDEVWLLVSEQCIVHRLFGRACASSPAKLALRSMSKDVGGSGVEVVRGGVSLDCLECEARLAFDRPSRYLVMPLLQRLDPFPQSRHGALGAGTSSSAEVVVWVHSWSAQRPSPPPAGSSL